MAKWKITSNRHIQQVGQNEPAFVRASKSNPAIVELPDSFKPSVHDKFIHPVNAVIDLGKPAHATPRGPGRPKKSHELKDSGESQG